MLRSFLVYLPSTILARIASFVVILAGTRLLDPAEYGHLALITLIGEWADMVLTNWTRIGLARLGTREEGLSRELAVRMTGVAAACTALAMVASSLAARVLSPEAGAPMIGALLLYLPSIAVARMGIALLQSARQERSASALEGVRALLVTSTSVSVMIASRSYIATSVATSTITLLVGGVTVVLGFRATRRTGPTNTSLRDVAFYAGPLIAIAALGQIITGLDKALLKSFHDAAALGYYAASFSIARAGFDALAIAMNTGTFVRTSALFNEGRHDRARKLLSRQSGLIIALALPALATLLAARDTIAAAVLPPDYRPVFVVAAPVVAAGAVLLNLKNFVYDNVFHLHLRNLRQVPTLLVGALVAVLLGLLLLPVHPVHGATVMWIGGAAASLLLSVALTSPLMRIPFPWTPLARSLGVGLATWGAITWIEQLLEPSVGLPIRLLIECGLGLCGMGLSLRWNLVSMAADSSFDTGRTA